MTRTDINGKTPKVGDKVRGFGKLVCNGGFKIDLTTTVTVGERDGIMYFGSVSASSFKQFEIVEKP